MTPRLTRVIADALVDDEHPVKSARVVIEAFNDDPEVLIKWLIKRGYLETVGWVNEDKPNRISSVGLNRNSVLVYKIGLAT